MNIYVHKQNFYLLRELQIHYFLRPRTVLPTVQRLRQPWQSANIPLTIYLSKNAGDLLKGNKR